MSFNIPTTDAPDDWIVVNSNRGNSEYFGPFHPQRNSGIFPHDPQDSGIFPHAPRYFLHDPQDSGAPGYFLHDPQDSKDVRNRPNARSIRESDEQSGKLNHLGSLFATQDSGIFPHTPRDSGIFLLDPLDSKDVRNRLNARRIRENDERSGRLNKYFLPADGIKREVIQAEICRYLGFDATCQPSRKSDVSNEQQDSYQHTDNDQGTVGYEIKAFRGLTAAMIEDLKADSKRWTEELRRLRQRKRDQSSDVPAVQEHSTDLSASDGDPGSNLGKLPGVLGEGRGPLVTTSTTPGPFRRRGRLLELPILLNNESFIALPDTGASCNMITYAAVEHLGTHFDNTSDGQRFTVGSGESIMSIGKVKIFCSFMDLAEKPTIEEFFVLNKLVDGVSTILGSPFLMASDIYGRYQFRLQKRTLNLGPRVALLSTIPTATSVAQVFFRIKINGNVEAAFADTGCDIDLVHEGWAIRRGLEFRDLEYGDCSSVQVANGSHYPIYHKVIVHFDTLRHRPLRSDDLETTKQLSETTFSSFHWQEKDESDMTAWKPKPSDQYRTFYVFKYLPCDVLIGQALLDGIDAYRIHKDSFIKVGIDGVELCWPRRPRTARETDEDHHLHVIRSKGWLLSKFKGREMNIGPNERTAYINWLSNRAHGHTDVQLNDELSRLISLNDQIHDHDSRMINAPDGRTREFYRNERQHSEEEFKAVAQRTRLRIS